MIKHKLMTSLVAAALLCGCNTLSGQERIQLQQLKANGITVDKSVGNWERPASPAMAGALNLLPGIGNFYLAAGNGGDSTHYLYGTLNLLFWPISILWGVPEAAVDANRINEREMIYYYRYDSQGKKDIAKAGVVLE